MNIQFNDSSPLFVQLIEMIKRKILKGELNENDPIPSVRQLSQELSLNPQTILKATQILVNENILEKRRGIGMFVKQGALKMLMKDEKEQFIQEELVSFLERASLLGISKNELVNIISNAGEKE